MMQTAAIYRNATVTACTANTNPNSERPTLILMFVVLVKDCQHFVPFTYNCCCIMSSRVYRLFFVHADNFADFVCVSILRDKIQ